jgi:hypothetical protein
MHLFGEALDSAADPATQRPRVGGDSGGATATAGRLRGGGDLLDVCRVCDAAATTLTAGLAS